MKAFVGLLALLFLLGSIHQSAAQTPSWDELRKYFMYSMSAYCTADYIVSSQKYLIKVKGLANWTCSWCTFVSDVPPLSDITIFETPDAGMGKIYGYIGRSNESIIIAFRGSSTTSNWILDFEFTHREYPHVPNAFVHAGFYAGYMQVAEIIIQTVIPLQIAYPNLTVICTGHSLGAALALLNANGLVQAGIQNVHVVDFGQPRVGNEVFSNYSKSILRSLYRTINQADIVPHLPPMDVGYHHAATELWFPSNYTTFVVCDDSGEDPNCSDSLKMKQLTIKDHINYLGYGWGGLEPSTPCS